MKDAIFVRHNMSSTPAVLKQLWTERLIALHYDDLESVIPADYRDNGGETPLQRLHDFCAEGVWVGADYRKISGEKQMLVGELKAGTQVLAREFVDESSRKSFVYKVAHLQNVKEISYEDHPLLASVQPRQGTICKWNSVNSYLSTLIAGENLAWRVTSLAPGQLEVLCSEYLRLNNRLACLLMPIGRTRKDIDIVGLDDHQQYVHAQVTGSVSLRTIQEKLAWLKPFQNSILFASGEMCQQVSGVECIPIEEVFAQMSEIPVYQAMLKKMLHDET